MRHSIIGPSAAAQWIYCAAAPHAQKDIPDTEEEATRIGLALHDVAASYFLHGVITQVGDVVRDIFINQDMLDRINQYIDIIEMIPNKNLEKFEEMVLIKIIHEECFGTPDHWAYDETLNVLYVTDYKDGFGSVEAIENWQMILYAIGIISSGVITDFKNLRMIFQIVQPQDYQTREYVKKWTLTYEELLPYYDQARKAANAAMAPNPLATAGPHCKHCKAKFQCKANSLTVNNLAEVAMYNPEAPGNDIAMEIEWLRHAGKMIKARLEAVEAQAVDMITTGNPILGWIVEPGNGKLNWKPDTRHLDIAASIYGVDIYKPKTLKTPTQVKAELKRAGMPVDAFKQFSEYTSGAMKLKPFNAKKAKELIKE